MIDNILIWLTKKSLREKPEFAVLALAYRGLEKAALGISLAAFLLSSPTISGPLLWRLQGEWVDQAFSELLTERYQKPVSVQHVRLASWRDIYFTSLQVRSHEGQLLISASHGNLRLKDFNLLKKKLCETEMRLEDITFAPAYYKNSPTFAPWSGILRKPVRIDHLLLKVVQNDESTFLEILKSESKDVHLEGSLLVGTAGKSRNAIRVHFSPWMMVKAIV